MVKVWLATTRKELAVLTQAARKLGVSVSQFVRGVVKAHRQHKSPKIPPQKAETHNTARVPRKRMG